MSSAANLLRDQFSSSGWRIDAPEQRDVDASSHMMGRSTKVPVWVFAADQERIVCDRPVQVEITADEDGCIASCDRLHVHAFGMSTQACLDDLHRQVVYFFNDYGSLAENEVTGLGGQLRKLYADHFCRQGL